MKKYNVSIFDIICFGICMWLMIYGFMGHLTPLQGALGWLLAMTWLVGGKVINYYNEMTITSYKGAITKYEEVIEMLKEGGLK